MIDQTDISAPAAGEGPFPSFYPPSVRARNPGGARTYSGISYAIALGYRNLHLDLHVPVAASPESPAPVVVWMHGGAWMLGSRDILPPHWEPGSVAQSLIDAGIAVASIDYRHARESPFPTQLHDAKAAIRYLRKFAPQLSLDPDAVGVWGESAGGHLAALCAVTNGSDFEGEIGVRGGDSSVAAAVCFFPVIDFARLPSEGFELSEEVRAQIMSDFGPAPGTPEEELLRGAPYSAQDGRRLASPLTHVSPAAPPFLIVHGADDRLVPPDQSELLASALTAVGVPADLVIVPGASHGFDGVDPMPLIGRAVAFLADRLGSVEL